LSLTDVLSHNISSMGQPEVLDERVDQFIVCGADGEIMHQFQVFRVDPLGILARTIKGGATLDQAMDKVWKWDGTTFGELARGLRNQDHWPSLEGVWHCGQGR
jgi:hypothetical protein